MQEPTCLCCARARLAGDPGKKNRRAGSLCSKGKPAAGGEVIGLRLAVKLDHDRTRKGRARPFKTSLQGSAIIPCPEQDDIRRFNA